MRLTSAFVLLATADCSGNPDRLIKREPQQRRTDQNASYPGPTNLTEAGLKVG